MISLSKALLGFSVVASLVASITINRVKTNNWYRDHPEAQPWLEENKYTRKDDSSLVSFVKEPTSSSFALGCYKLIFGGQGFKQLYQDANIDSHKDHRTGPHPESYLTGSDIFDDYYYEPILGCSTAHRKKNNVYEFELALKQGDKGLVERVSAHTNKIISQVVFYDKDKQLFGLYKYIWQEHQVNNNKSIYKLAEPKTNGEDPWSDLTVKANEDNQSKYYSVWVEGSKGEGMFDSLGIKSNGKIFSSLVDIEHENSSDFIYVPPSEQGELSQTLITDSTSPKRYDLSSLYYLRKQIQSRRGKWKQLTTFCPATKDNVKDRMNIKDLKKLTKYCYKKTEE